MSEAREAAAPPVNLRVGIGYDVHPTDAERPLVLGGVEIAGAPGLAGHSDADCLAHAVADALLGALALGDLGSHFPDTDPAWRGARSLDLLARVAALVASRGWAAVNVDATVIAESPRLAPHVAGMRENLAAALGLEADSVSVKATRPERLGALGRGEGLAACAVVLVTRGEREKGTNG